MPGLARTSTSQTLYTSYVWTKRSVFVCLQKAKTSLVTVGTCTRDTRHRRSGVDDNTPQACRRTRDSDGEPCRSEAILCTCMELFFFCGVQNVSLPAAGVFPRSRLRCTQGATCTPRCRCESRPASAARALGVRSRQIGQVIARLLSDQLEPTRPIWHPVPTHKVQDCNQPSGGAAGGPLATVIPVTRKQQNKIMHLQLAWYSRA